MINNRPRSASRLAFCILGALLLTLIVCAGVSYALPAGYTNQVQHTIAGSSDGLLSSYVMRLTIYNQTGTNSGSVLYVGSACRSDFNDVMINDSTDTTTFPRFISWSESGANYVVIYYNITTGVPAAGTTINIYYGNSAATNPDSGSNVFKHPYHQLHLNSQF
jgi:hypothetical protein